MVDFDKLNESINIINEVSKITDKYNVKFKILILI